MSKEYFWGDALSSSKKEIKWNPSFEDEEDEETLDIDGIQHFLFLKQAVLGVKAKEGERNVVEITTENFDGDDVKQPLFSLKLGLNESSLLDIAVQPPATFSLVSGTGPVYLNGQHMIEINADDEDEDGDLEEEEEEEEEDLDIKASPDLPITKSKKRPLSTSESTAKKIKMSKPEKEVHEEEEEDDEEMPEMEEDNDDDDDDDDDDEDDEDFEGEDDDEEEDSDDEEEEEDEEEDEESPEKPVKKVKGKKGKMNGTASAKGDGKLKTKEATNSVTKSKGKKKVLGLDEIKKKVQESTSVPKKEEKFKNFIRSTFHMTDTKKLNDVWGWYKGSVLK